MSCTCSSVLALSSTWLERLKSRPLWRPIALAMNNELFGWAALALWLAGIVASVIGAFTWPRGPACRCRGPACRRPRPLLSPGEWFIRGRCWYILSGHPIDKDGLVCCPECGVRSSPAHRMRDGRRMRWNRLGASCLLAGIALFACPWISSGSWVRPIPTAVLAVIEDSPSAAARVQLRAETWRRITDGTVTGWSATVLAARLANDLHHDGERWNAYRAARLLEQLWPQSNMALERMLGSGDAQARLIAADILRRKSITPSPALLRACINDLRNDSSEVNWYLSQGNALSAAAYLVRWAQDAEPLLAHAMRSDDWQQRLLAAAVAGHACRLSLIDQAAPVLIEHLRDNSMSGDAKVAAPALSIRPCGSAASSAVRGYPRSATAGHRSLDH